MGNFSTQPEPTEPEIPPKPDKQPIRKPPPKGPVEIPTPLPPWSLEMVPTAGFGGQPLEVFRLILSFAMSGETSLNIRLVVCRLKQTSKRFFNYVHAMNLVLFQV